MATGVAKDAGAQIEKATAKISNPIIACVQTALQSRYGGAIAQVFAQESQKNLEANAEQQPVKIDTSDLVASNAASISGLVLVVTRRVIGKVVQTVGTRIAGVVASEIVSAVAGIVGLALIAKDIYDAGDGVFPIIAERMKAEETKLVIKDEIGKTIQADIGQQVGQIAQETCGEALLGLARLQAEVQPPAFAQREEPDLRRIPEGPASRPARQARPDRRYPLRHRGREESSLSASPTDR